MSQEFYEMKRQIDERKKRQNEKYNENSKQRLINGIAKKFKTTIIGSLAVFEEHFGYLWGHGKDIKDLTKEEKTFYNIWMRARSELLDKGNNHARAAEIEIGEYTISWDRYKTKFVVRRQRP